MMKMKIVAGILMGILILCGVSSAAAANYNGHDPITIQKGKSFELDIPYNEWIESKGYDHSMLKLTKKSTYGLVDNSWINVYTFKAQNTGTTQIKIKNRILWWVDERTVVVNIQ